MSSRCFLTAYCIIVLSPNRVNRAHWPTKENRQNFVIFLMFPAHAKNGPRWAQMGPGGFFPTNPDLPDVLGRTDLDFENFYFFDFFGFQIPRFPGPQKSCLGQAWAGLGPGWARLSQAGPGWALLSRTACKVSLPWALSATVARISRPQKDKSTVGVVCLSFSIVNNGCPLNLGLKG